MTVAFDNTMLSILLNPDGNVPLDAETGRPVEYATERAEALVQRLEKERQRIILPTPAIAELLTIIGLEAQAYVNTVKRSRIFEFGNFDARAAAELALLNRDTFKADDKKNKLEPYQKVKFDRQIIAICRVYGATEIYTDDKGMARRARLCGITPFGVADLELPDSTRQGRLDLAAADDLPEEEEDGED